MPMPLRDGVLIKQQATNLSTAETPDISLSILEWDLQPVVTNGKSGQIHTNSVESITEIMELSYEGTLNCEISGENHDQLIERVMGNLATSGPTDTAAYTHTHKFGTTLAERQARLEKGSTIEGGSDGVFFTATGAVFDGFDLTVTAGEYVQLLYNYKAYDGSTESGSGETHAPLSILKMFKPKQVVLKAGVLASEVVIPFLGITCNLTRGVTARHGDKSVITPTKFQENPNTEVTCTFSLDQDATERAALNTAFANGTLHSVIIELTSDQLIPSCASTYYKTTFNLKEGKYTGKTPGVDGNTRTEEYVFMLGKSAQADPMTIVNINGVISP